MHLIEVNIKLKHGVITRMMQEPGTHIASMLLLFKLQLCVVRLVRIRTCTF